jgi:CelD/BcsL family acetyltransferase involved in cellulose biosynthesis
MDGVSALAADPCVDRAEPNARNDIAVEVAGAGRLMEIEPAWIDLLARADAPNVFMDPALALSAAAHHPRARIRALLAWRSIHGSRQLDGVWSFGVGRARKSLLPVDVLNVPPLPFWHLATPVIDRDALDRTLDAMLDCLAAEPSLPKIIALESMGEGPTMAALTRVLARRNSAPLVFERFNRPKLASSLDGKAYLERVLSASSRKKLRQHRRRLSEKGELTSVAATQPDAVGRALEEFLTLEASGWKGAQGTALLCSEADAAFMRASVSALAEQGRAVIYSLRLDGKPVSMQLVARAGPAAFTWKTAYDERLRDFSPGMLLFEDYTAALLADKRITFVDSCSYDDSGFMSAWTERQAVTDLWIDARRGGSLAFRVLGGLQKGYRGLRAVAKTTYLNRRPSRAK